MISIIAAIGKNNELGKDNKLLWHLPGDMKFFKEITSNHKVIMGLNTFYSIGRSLPNRENIVLSDQNVNIENVKVYRDINELIDKEMDTKDEVFIIGGASLYNYFIDKSDRLYITYIEDSKDADVYFPKIDKDKYIKKVLDIKEDNDIKYSHVLYERKDRFN